MIHLEKKKQKKPHIYSLLTIPEQPQPNSCMFQTASRRLVLQKACAVRGPTEVTSHPLELKSLDSEL